jgi:hypothetical protein
MPGRDSRGHIPHQSVDVHVHSGCASIGKGGPAETAGGSDHNGDRAGQRPAMPPIRHIVHGPAFGIVWDGRDFTWSRHGCYGRFVENARSIREPI